MEIKQHACEQPTSWKKSKGKSKCTEKQMKMKHNTTKSMGFSKSSAKKEVHSNKSLPQETRETLNKQSFILKAIRKRRT